MNHKETQMLAVLTGSAFALYC